MLLVDPNMDTALQWANELGTTPSLPPSLQDVNQRAKLVNDVDGPLISNSLLNTLSNNEKAGRLKEVARLSQAYMLPILDRRVRANITLRLWAGCLSAAKTIALETRSGPNTPDLRSLVFAQIDSIAARDPIYRAGVEAAPHFKKLRNQGYCFEGVPVNSAVRSVEH